MRGSKTGKVWGATLASFLTAVLLSGTSVWLFERSRMQTQRQTVSELTSQVAVDIQAHVQRSLSATFALAAVIRQGNGDTSNFRQLAKEMLLLYPGVSSLSIAPGGIVTDIAPLEGNEKALGHNLFEDPKRNKEALFALRTRALTLAGPFQLLQGGEAVVGRLPVFLSGRDGVQRYWGFSSALISIPALLQEARVQRLTSNRCSFELSRIQPDTGKPDVFYSAGRPLDAAVHQKIAVPNGEWTLSVQPMDGWYAWQVVCSEALVILLFSTLSALAARWLALRPIILQQMVDERTRELSETNLSLQTEIKDRKLAQEALLASEHKLRSICTSLTDLILILDAEGHYVEIASTTSSHLYRPADELLGKSVAEIFPPETAEFFLATIRQALAVGKMVSVDYPLTIGAESLWFAGNVSPLSADRVVWSARDITQTKNSEEEQLVLERQLLHSQKLESLGVLAGGIAHDFNNILMAIIGNADLALMRISQESPVVGNLHQIEQAAARAADLTRQMLAYSGRGKFVVENISLNRLLEEMLHLLEVSISKMAVLRLNLAPNLPTVEVDATQMHQIVMNLVINASEAIGDRSGTIAISTGCVDCDRNYLKDVWLDENLGAGLYVYLEVADTGCGMDRETMGKIFDPFFTTKFTGRGLGMAAVIGIVRGHQGAIKVSSEPGKGSSFKVLLPSSGKPAELFGSAGSHDDWKGAGTVLLVDDEETVRGIGRAMLQELGFSTLTANDGREALEIFQATPGIALVILDLTMPHMNGEQCFRELKRCQPEVKVILSSGYNEQEVTEKFTGTGLAGFIQKPYTLSELRQVLMQHAGES